MKFSDLGVGVAVLDGLRGIEVAAAQLEHDQHGGGVGVALGDDAGAGRELGLLYCFQPLGLGIVTVRSVSLSGGTGGLSRRVSRYCVIGTGVVVLVGVEDFGRGQQRRESGHVAAACRGDDEQRDGRSKPATGHRISRTESSGLATRVPLGVTTNGRSIRIGFSAIASSSRRRRHRQVQLGVQRLTFRTAVATSMPASSISLTSSARDGGVFRYWITVGSIPLSRNSSSALREVVQRGLW